MVSQETGSGRLLMSPLTYRHLCMDPTSRMNSSWFVLTMRDRELTDTSCT